MSTADFTHNPLNYDSRSIRLHWVTAALVTVLWCLGQTVDWFPKGDLRTAVRSTHITLGAVLALILAYRIWWRISHGRRLPARGSGIEATLARFAHFALYAVLVLTVALGVANPWVRGDNLFNLLTIPAFDPGNKMLRHQVGALHAWLANALLCLAALHAASGLAHRFIGKDDVLRRMLPARG
ncbi:MAG TPA: cytochrome b/b6 domain-containing protein [Rudaea sp.]|jgi:cytochrome b561